MGPAGGCPPTRGGMARRSEEWGRKLLVISSRMIGDTLVECRHAHYQRNRALREAPGGGRARANQTRPAAAQVAGPLPDPRGERGPDLPVLRDQPPDLLPVVPPLQPLGPDQPGGPLAPAQAPAPADLGPRTGPSRAPAPGTGTPGGGRTCWGWCSGPFRLNALVVDGGSEFGAACDQACQRRGLRLFVLPPPGPPSAMALWNGPSAPIRRSSTKSPTAPWSWAP